MNMESAVAQACHIHRLHPPGSSSHENPPALAHKLDNLLDDLRSTMIKIPPFTPGDNCLAWVCSVAALRSTKAEHKSFFTLRLAELQQRAGFPGYGQYSTGASMGETFQSQNYN